MRKFYFSVFCLCFFSFATSQSLTLIEAGGWLETAFVKWVPDETADLYKVYYTGEGVTDKQIDTQLIRRYEGYFRADIPGLKAGTYTLKIVPVTGNVEGTATVTNQVTVQAHDRNGFAFFGGRVPGAYTPEGTPKSDAVILYITQKSKNTISMEVAGANENPCVGIQTILDGFKKGKDNRPLIVRFIGQITDPAYLLNGDIVVENNNNTASFITLEGIGDDAVADGWGIRIKNAANIEIRNLGTMNCNSDEGDNISLQQDNEFIWVHHCDFFYGNPGGDADQAKGDGALDSKRSGYVTFSYNHFWDTGKSNLLGNGIEEPRYLTYHHNWYDHSDSRHPRVRSHHVHVYNNYYDGIAKYGIGSTNASSVFVEGNYFRNCAYPMLISMQGSDVWSSSKNANDYTTMPTFSKEDGGIIKAYNNYIVGQKRFVAYGDPAYAASTVDFDAFVVQQASEQIPAAVKAYKGGGMYSNFDTNPALMYTYSADDPETARDKVIQWAGRMGGGDFKWTFTEADESSSDVNQPLRAALAAYTSGLLSVQGEGSTPDEDDPDEDDPSDEDPPAVDVFHSFTASGKESSNFSFNGNLSDSKGTVEYGGQTLTVCMKIESSTSISFKTAKEAKLTLVFNSDFNGRIKIDGESYTAVGGVLTLTLPAGTHEITKADVANLFFIGVDYLTSASASITTQPLKVVFDSSDSRLYVRNYQEGRVTVNVYSVSGQLFRSAVYTSDGMDVSGLPSGVYLVKLITENGGYSQKIFRK